MPDYRRNRVPAGTYFFTVNLANRRSDLLVREIQTLRDYAAHLDYVHFNPVKHGVVTHPAAWRFSTFQRCVSFGLYDEAWCGEDGNMSSGIGERR